MKKIIISCLLCLSFFVSAGVIKAQGKSALSLDVSPSVSYLYVKPGAGISLPLILTNNGRYSLRIVPQLVDFHPESQTGRVILEQKSDFKQLSIAGNQELWGQELMIKPGEDRVLPLVIAVPSDFPQGEYHLSVLLQAEQMLFSDYEKTANSKLFGIVASHLILMVSADEEDRSQVVINDFKLPKIVDSLFVIRSQIAVKNIGLNAGPASGKLTISHWPSAENKVYEFYPDMVLANSERLLRGMSSEALAKLKLLDQEKAVLEANGEDPLAKQAALLQSELTSNFYYKQPFLLGAYNFKLELGDEIVTQRVLALPFSILGSLLLLPVLYRLFVYFLALFDKNNDDHI